MSVLEPARCTSAPRSDQALLLFVLFRRNKALAQSNDVQNLFTVLFAIRDAERFFDSEFALAMKTCRVSPTVANWLSHAVALGRSHRSSRQVVIHGRRRTFNLINPVPCSIQILIKPFLRTYPLSRAEGQHRVGANTVFGVYRYDLRH